MLADNQRNSCHCVVTRMPNVLAIDEDYIFKFPIEIEISMTKFN